MKMLYAWFAASLLATAQAASYPERPIRVVVPYVAGGAADITARVIAQKMSESLGVSVVVENRPGANGMIGTDFVAKANPDGYTLLFDASGPLVVNPSLYQSVPYDPLTDLAPISQVTSYQYALVTHRDSPIRSVDDLITTARTNPGSLSYGSAGIGAGGHLAGELLGQMTDAQFTHVPYKGNAQALTDALSGQLSFTFDTIVTAVPHIATGRLRAFAVTGPTRSHALPDLPTLDELGYQGFAITQFQGLLAPAGTPPELITRLHDEVVKAARQPDVIRKLADEGGYDLVASTPDVFAQLLRSDLERYRTLLKQAKVQAQ